MALGPNKSSESPKIQRASTDKVPVETELKEMSLPAQCLICGKMVSSGQYAPRINKYRFVCQDGHRSEITLKVDL